MLRRSSLLVPATVVVVALALAGLGLGRGTVPARAGGEETASVRSSSAARSEPCPVAVERVRALASVTAGSAVVAVRENRLVAVGSRGTARLSGASAGPGMLRNVAASRFGVAYVEDRFGPDVVVIASAHGTVRLPQGAEATNPAWSSRGDLAWSVGTGLRTRSRRGRIGAIRGPVRGGTLFSPVFNTPQEVVAAVSMPPTLAVPEDEWLNNLWSYDRRTGRWRQVTHFTASADRWTAVRTPVARRDGAVEFVRITGRGSATRMPAFQLWRLTDQGGRKVRALPGERYLAGFQGGRRVWQVPDARSGAFRLVGEGPGGERQLGCGAVSADPLDTVDPDRRSRHGKYAPPRGHWSSLLEEAGAASEVPEVGILVGDFATRAAAEAAVARILLAYTATAPAQVVDARSAPHAILPGVYGALLTLPSDANVIAALTDLRRRLPDYADKSWVVTP
jgi:hypothetical protein